MPIDVTRREPAMNCFLYVPTWTVRETFDDAVHALYHPPLRRNDALRHAWIWIPGDDEPPALVASVAPHL